MIFKSLILGILFSISVFAVKSGMGFSYVIQRHKGSWWRLTAVLVFAATYGLVFLLAALILQRLDPVRHLQAIQTFMQSGMLIHILMAALMLIWGWVLLKRRRSDAAKTRGWLILAAPCPVCATVILLSMAFLRALLPDHFSWLVLGLYASFMLLGLLTAWIAGLYQEARGQPSETLLGGAMMLIAAWFLISVTVMPQFADLDKVYRLADYHSGTQVKQAFSWLWAAVLPTVAFMLGYGLTHHKIRKKS
ncbi:DUF2162 domain-containing protein [uncultured Desulfosarcina sp.]|uniref:DUF2162 domain-containing protein n=1 Tax=uncultured Desulfosarcina sp. TaxID=218289 RepID=UPI0029C61CA2|nr:DUF2162 domain-containing protein [uncultured Desulfosarcina sp.]